MVDHDIKEEQPGEFGLFPYLPFFPSLSLHSLPSGGSILEVLVLVLLEEFSFLFHLLLFM